MEHLANYYCQYLHSSIMRISDVNQIRSELDAYNDWKFDNDIRYSNLLPDEGQVNDEDLVNQQLTRLLSMRDKLDRLNIHNFLGDFHGKASNFYIAQYCKNGRDFFEFFKKFLTQNIEIMVLENLSILTKYLKLRTKVKGLFSTYTGFCDMFLFRLNDDISTVIKDENMTTERICYEIEEWVRITLSNHEKLSGIMVKIS